MLFISLVYIFIFLPIVIIVYSLLLKKHLITVSKLWLIIASLVFYAYYDPKYTFLLLFSMAVNFLIGSSFNLKVFTDSFRRKLLLFTGLAFNLLLLGYYKYANFFIDNINAVFQCDINIQKIVLPLGISFFTFTQISYLVDGYKKEVKDYNLTDYMLFVTFFPHLIAGPILYHKEMIPQFSELKRKVFQYKNLIMGIFLFTIGLCKKVIFADSLSTYVNYGYGSAEISMIEGWIVTLSYTLQIYFDFSGYTDMALGSAKMLNIDLPLNFNSPYKANSVQDFWRRWHITLSRFLKDYVYIPLGGNRKGEVRTYCNLLTTMLIGGLWHGASWTYVVWGGLHGLALCVNKFWKNTNIKFANWFNIFLTFLFINLTLIIFRSDSFIQAKKIFTSLVNYHNFIVPDTYFATLKFAGNRYDHILLLLPLSLLIIFACKNSNEIISNIKLQKKNVSVLISIIFALLFIIAVIKTITVPYSEFIYFNF